MAITPALQQFLEQKGARFQEHPHQAETSLSTLCMEMGIDACQVAVPVMLQTARKANLMAVIPLGHSLDLDRVAGLLRRDFHYMDDELVGQFFPGVEAGAEPPLAEFAGLPCIVDRALMVQERVFFRAGHHASLISVDGSGFSSLMQTFPKVTIANPPAVSSLAPAQPAGPLTDQALRRQLEALQRLPAMPAMTIIIIRLLGSPATTAGELAEAIELDPAMAAQIIRYASSPYFGYRGRLNSVQDAISRVLGFDLVSSIALGIASGKAFDVTQEGPYGLKAFWKHALYCAVVCQSLARKIDKPEQLNPATAYLCGLLHNLGILLIGHLFPDMHARLNQMAADQPEQSLPALEAALNATQDAAKPGALPGNDLASMGHDRLGACLLGMWRLPSPVVASCLQHHQAHPEGPDADYVRLVQISNRLLAQRQLGDLGVSGSASEHFGAGLISLSAAEAVFQKVMEMCSGIDSLAEQMVA